MRLPYSESAIIPEDKIIRYLLDLEHPVGRSKALFFIRQGFTLVEWWELALALKNHARNAEVKDFQNTEFGQRFVVDGLISTPSGRTPNIRSIWIILNGEEIPRLVSAYPKGDKS